MQFSIELVEKTILCRVVLDEQSKAYQDYAMLIRFRYFIKDMAKMTQIIVSPNLVITTSTAQ